MIKLKLDSYKKHNLIELCDGGDLRGFLEK